MYYSTPILSSHRGYQVHIYTSSRYVVDIKIPGTDEWHSLDNNFYTRQQAIEEVKNILIIG
jgi:hypothetical protein